jgi:hypothetical protein
MPHTGLWAAVRASSGTLAVAAFVGLGVFVYLMRVLRGEQEYVPRSQTWLLLAAGGLAVFVGGYLVGLFTGRIGFSSTGIANRSAIAASVGLAVTIVAVVGWLSLLSSREEIGRRAFAGTVALVCVSGFLTINVLADSWGGAWVKEQAILARINAAFPDIPSNSALILHGVCPYVGPGIVFESSWDLAGALQVRYHDPAIAADITSSRLTIAPDGLQTTIYGGKPRTYPYGPHLMLFDYRDRAVVPLPDAESAWRELRKNPIPSCIGAPGRGAILLPMDQLYVNWLRNPLP